MDDGRGQGGNGWQDVAGLVQFRNMFVYLRGALVGEEEFCHLGRVTKGTGWHAVLRLF